MKILIKTKTNGNLLIFALEFINNLNFRELNIYSDYESK